MSSCPFQRMESKSSGRNVMLCSTDVNLVSFHAYYAQITGQEGIIMSALEYSGGSLVPLFAEALNIGTGLSAHHGNNLLILLT